MSRLEAVFCTEFGSQEHVSR